MEYNDQVHNEIKTWHVKYLNGRVWCFFIGFVRSKQLCNQSFSRPVYPIKHVSKCGCRQGTCIYYLCNTLRMSVNNMSFNIWVLAIATPGIPCVDKLPHCDVYDDAICRTNRLWAEANCRAYCLICTPGGKFVRSIIAPDSMNLDA